MAVGLYASDRKKFIKYLILLFLCTVTVSCEDLTVTETYQARRLPKLEADQATVSILSWRKSLPVWLLLSHTDGLTRTRYSRKRRSRITIRYDSFIEGWWSIMLAKYANARTAVRWLFAEAAGKLRALAYASLDSDVPGDAEPRQHVEGVIYFRLVLKELDEAKNPVLF